MSRQAQGPRASLGRLVLLLLIAGAGSWAGCDRSPTAQTPASSPNGPAGDGEINREIVEMLIGHGLVAKDDGGGWVAIEGSAVRMNGSIASDEAQENGGRIVQLAFRLRLPDGRIVEQPVVGMGDDRAGAIGHAHASFLLGTLHAWLAAFVDPAEDHVVRKDLTIAGRPRSLTLGDTITKTLGHSDAGFKVEHKWKDALFAELAKSDLGPGAHWVDFYQGRIKDKQLMEIQLDNRRSPELEKSMAGADYPFNGTYTSVRLFLVIQDAQGDPSRPTTRPATRPIAHPATHAATQPADHPSTPSHAH